MTTSSYTFKVHQDVKRREGIRIEITGDAGSENFSDVEDAAYWIEDRLEELVKAEREKIAGRAS